MEAYVQNEYVKSLPKTSPRGQPRTWHNRTSAAVTQDFTHSLFSEPSAKPRAGNAKQQKRWDQGKFRANWQLREIKIMVLVVPK